MLHVHFGNRVERLADAFAAELSGRPPADPFAPEVIVIGHAGMDEWLKRALAARLGIAANLEFHRPASFVWRLLRARDPRLPRASPLDRGPLAWRLYAALGEAGQAPGVARYLHAGDALSRYELADALAAVFEQYQIYRPAMILDWEAGRSAGGDAAWQAALWRQVADAATPNPARLYRDFVDHVGELAPDALPRRVSVFGLSALPPVYLDLFAAAARRRELHLYVPNPSREYWGDIADAKRLARLRRDAPGRAEYATSGHPLLAALGAQNRDFIESLQELPGDAVTHEHFEAPCGASLLARLQSDVLALVETPERRPPSGDDDSILVHVCHSRRREVEVLHDTLLAAFEADSDLGPEDVLVMAPNMDDYAGHIAAVFGAAPAERHIPWSLAERSGRAEHPLAEALLTLLDLPESRLKASEVLGLLDLPAVARRLQLDAEALENIHRWVGEAGIRWAWDGDHRAQFGLPAEPAFTWRFGLDRLLVGYALAPDDDAPWQGIAPWGALEGQSARALGALYGFIATLEEWRQTLAEPRPLAGWTAAMQELLGLFVAESPDELRALAVLRQAIGDLAAEAALAGFDERVPRKVARTALAARLAVPRHPRPFLSGRVTFCALAPMRSIPANILCLLGMGEADFPRRGRAPGFDLIAAQPEHGDRARRREDRALFLEALLAARRAFHLSYVGRSERDNGELPASVVVNALLDTLERMGAARETIVVVHSLQPFSASYRPEPRRRASYAREWLSAPTAAAPAPFAVPLPAGETDSDIALDDLIAGLANPARRYLDALGVARPAPDAAAEDEELFTLADLDRWRVKDTLLARWLEVGPGFDPATSFGEFAARAWLPPGEAGRLAFIACAAEVRAVVEEVFAAIGAAVAETRTVNLVLGPWRLHGAVAGMYPRAGLVRARAGALRAKDRLRLWIEHLALHAAGEADLESRFIAIEKGRPKLLRLVTADEPERRLRRLCERYAESARGLLPFLPDLSFEFEKIRSDKGRSAAEIALRSRWRHWESGDGFALIRNGEDYALVARGRSDGFGDDFAELAEEIFGAAAAAEGES